MCVLIICRRGFDRFKFRGVDCNANIAYRIYPDWLSVLYVSFLVIHGSQSLKSPLKLAAIQHSLFFLMFCFFHLISPIGCGHILSYYGLVTFNQFHSVFPFTLALKLRDGPLFSPKAVTPRVVAATDIDSSTR